MTKRRLYAQLAVALTWLWCGATAAGQRLDPPCGACVVLTIDRAQALLLPGDLRGLTVLVRAQGAEPNPRQLLETLGEIRRRGGRGGVAVFQQDARSGSIDALAFELKQALTEYRAIGSASAVIALVVPVPLKAPLLERGLAAYVDTFLRQAPDLSTALEWTREGDREVAVAAPDESDLASALIATVVTVADALPRDLTPAKGVSLDCGDARGDVYLNPSRQEHVALLRCHPQASTRAPALPLPGGATLLRMPAPSEERFVEDVLVSAGRRLAVEEVVARHQAVARRQRTLVRTRIASGSLTLTFEAPGFPAPVTIESKTVIYDDGGTTDLEQREIRVNGIAFRGGAVPRLPILEAERVSSPPLTITLTDRYRYELEAEEVLDGARCYVVAFAPAVRGEAAFRGRAWIAMDSFALLKVSAAQTGLRGPIISSEQVDEFERVAEGVWLLARSDVRQIYEGAGHRTPIHRRLRLDEHVLDAPDFTARRDAAYASPSVMLRDTPEGYRYLRKTEDHAGQTTAARAVVAEAARRVRTLAGGVIVDPNISRPLPFAGISYVDFDLFGTGAQLNVFFGGAFGQLAFSVPSLFGSRWQLAGRAFGIVTAYNDRAFRNGREIYAEAIRQRPAQAALWLVRPLTTHISVRGGYDFDYTRLRPAPETAASFIVPADQVVHAARLALEGQRGGWAASLWWNPARRSGWRPWGTGTDYEPRHHSFQRFGATVSKSTVVTRGLVGRVEAQWMDGSDLDRFSRYSFGTFDNRLRGYPSALIRYDRGGALRGAVAWAASRLVRVDGFVDTAAVRDRGFGGGLRNYTGVGAAIEAPAPFGLLTAVEWGYGFRGVQADGGIGTHVIRVSFYKVF